MRYLIIALTGLLTGCIPGNTVEQSQNLSLMVLVERENGEVKVIERSDVSISDHCPMFSWSPSRTKPIPPTVLDAYTHDPDYVIQVMSQRVDVLNTYIDDMTKEYQATYQRYLNQCLKD